MAHPLVHVLVINWNGLEHLEACFDSLLADAYPNVAYILVDNASDDGSVEFIQARYRNDDRVRVVACPENLGWSGGNNYAIERSLAASADYIFLINNDTATAPDAVARLVEAAEADAGIGALAPKMVMFHQPDILNSVGLVCSEIGGSWDRGIGRLDGPAWDATVETVGACGGAMFLRADALRRAGLLPERFDIYLDDLDLCLRIWDVGYSIRTCPGAVVRHKFSATYGAGARVRRKYYLNTRNRFRIVLRNFPARTLLRVAVALAVGEVRAIGRAVLEGALGRVGAHVRAWLAAIAYLPAALRARRQAGRELGRFWRLVQARPQFCPAFELPADGWYSACAVGDASVRPFARRASIRTDGGALRVVHANPYPHVALTDVRVVHEGETLATLRTGAVDAVDIVVPCGTVTFESERIFTAEETGATVDYGGWVAWESMPHDSPEKEPTND